MLIGSMCHSFTSRLFLARLRLCFTPTSSEPQEGRSVAERKVTSHPFGGQAEQRRFARRDEQHTRVFPHPGAPYRPVRLVRSPVRRRRRVSYRAGAVRTLRCGDNVALAERRAAERGLRRLVPPG